MRTDADRSLHRCRGALPRTNRKLVWGFFHFNHRRCQRGTAESVLSGNASRSSSAREFDRPYLHSGNSAPHRSCGAMGHLRRFGPCPHARRCIPCGAARYYCTGIDYSAWPWPREVDFGVPPLAAKSNSNGVAAKLVEPDHPRGAHGPQRGKGHVLRRNAGLPISRSGLPNA
jgi:hypothetical protein